MLSNRLITRVACVALGAPLVSIVMTGCSDPGGSPVQPSPSLQAPATGSAPSGRANVVVVAWNCFRAAQTTVTSSSETVRSANTLVFHQPQEGCSGFSRATNAEAGSNVVAPQVAPGPPSSLSFLIIGTTVALTWSAPTTGDPATSYQIEAGSTSGATNIADFDTGSSATSMNVANVPNGTYYVRVRARNATGTSTQASNEVVIVVGNPGSCNAAPLAPSGLTASVSGFSIVLTWTAPGGGNIPTSYILEAGTSSGATNIVVFDTGSTATTINATAGPGNYFVRARAKNACGTGAASNGIVITIGAISCSYKLETPISQTFGSTGGTGDITLTTTAACGWQVDVSAMSEDFVSVSFTVIQGSGTRTFTVRSITSAPQPPLPRSGPLYVYEAGSSLRLFSVTITQNP